MRQQIKLFLVGSLTLGFVYFGLFERRVVAFVNGPLPGNTGAPGEGICSDCHTGGTSGGTLSITGLPATYVEGQEVTLTVTLAQGGRLRFGFQATAIDSMGKAAGTLILTDSNRTQLVSGEFGGGERSYIEHTGTGAFPVSGGQGSWSFRWRPPSASTGTVTFYVAGNAANGNGSTAGDSIYRISVSAAPTIGPLVSVSAASFQTKPVSPNSIVAAFGSELTANGGTAIAATLPLPEELLQTRVRVTDSGGTERGAALFYVSPGQINLEIPGGTVSGIATVKVVRNNQTIAQGTVQIDTVSPGIFMVLPSPGNNLAAAQVFRVKGDGSSGFEEIVRLDSATGRFVSIPIDFGPATDQLFLVLYGTAFRFNSGTANVTATIGGTASQVQYANVSPPFVGLDQANLTLPRSLAGRGDLDVILVVDSKQANTVVINTK